MVKDLGSYLGSAKNYVTFVKSLAFYAEQSNDLHAAYFTCYFPGKFR